MGINLCYSCHPTEDAFSGWMMDGTGELRIKRITDGEDVNDRKELEPLDTAGGHHYKR